MTRDRVSLAAAALLLCPTMLLAQDDPRTVGVSVEGALVEVPVDMAAEACGIDAETLLAEWETLGGEVSTMADTSVNADAMDLAPEVAADTAMDSTIDGVTVADGADATHEADADAATDVVSDVEATAATDPTTADIATAEEATAGTGQEATDGPATPTEGTVLSKAAVCEISRATADEVGIPAGG